MADHPKRILVVKLSALASTEQCDAARSWHQARAPSGVHVMVCPAGQEIVPPPSDAEILAELRAIRALLERFDADGVPGTRVEG